MTGMNTFGLIGLTEENVGVDRRFYTGYTSTNGTFAVSYNVGRVDVFLNGIKLVGNHSGNSNYDYTMDSTTGAGSTITLDTGVALVSADVLECVGYVSNSSNTVTSYNPTPSSGDGGWNVFASISHTASDLVNVFLNGVLLDDSDYTLDASADTVTIGGATLTASDVVVIQVIGALDNSNFVPASGGTFSGNVAYTGNIQVDDIVEKTSAHGVEIDGVTLKDGSVTPSGNLHLTTSGAGISFHPHGASQVNLLDDYEEGVWNPTITGQTNPTSVTTTFTNGKYTKIGRLVVCSGQVTITAPGSSTGGLYLTLPFTASNNDSAGNGAEMAIAGYSCAVYGENPNSIRVIKYDFTSVIITSHAIRLSYSFYTA